MRTKLSRSECAALGGVAVSRKMTPEQRTERARKAAHARWGYARRFREVLAEINAELDAPEAK